uniref:Myosin light chain 9 n=1 Tax=Ornithorhynchus anatinus TaxID=9258 RepID=A0A6I8PBD4_ORNAN
MSSKRAKAKTTKKRPQRATSNVFAMFDQSQIQEFKEAFNMIDQNRDGFIDKEDLHDMLASLGKNPTDEYLEGMMSEAPGPINFTMFLTMFGEKLNGTDPEDVIRNAFACFDEEASGVIHEDHLRELLTTMGDRFTDEEDGSVLRKEPEELGRIPRPRKVPDATRPKPPWRFGRDPGMKTSGISTLVFLCSWPKGARSYLQVWLKCTAFGFFVLFLYLYG